MDTKPLLIEIFVEELPFSGITLEIDNVLPKFINILNNNYLSANIDFFWTARRLILFTNNFPNKQETIINECFGPPVSIAYDINNNPTIALNSFLNKFSISKDILEIKTKDSKEYVLYKQEIKGKYSIDILEDLILEWLDKLHFVKSMKWGSVDSSFIRPIRGINVILGDTKLKLKKLINKYDLQINSSISPHRHFAPISLENIKSPSQYLDFLKNNGVIYNQKVRKNKIEESLKKLESKYHIKVDIDMDLLNEIIAINEYPNVVYREFDSKFLILPDEVIITSMKVNQKYFATYKNDKLNNGFIVVCNITEKRYLKKILDGNLKVLKARLEDALFFYNNDLNSFISTQEDSRLSNVEFIKDCGNLFEKIQREKEIAKILVSNVKDINKNVYKDIIHSISISKNDLLSEMVSEFGELQGTMGSYYAKGQSKVIIESLRYQYHPLEENGKLPPSMASCIVAISNKLDSIFTLFSINKIPSGSKDPFALRRACNGIIRMIIKFKIPLNLEFILDNTSYKKIDRNKLLIFFYERFENILNVNQSIINAAIKSKQKDLYQLYLQIKTLDKIIKSEFGDEFKSLFKRVSNILKNNDLQIQLNPSLLTINEEKALFDKLTIIKKANIQDPDDRVKYLLELRHTLKDFFDNVLINSENKTTKANRIAILRQVYEEFLKLGDILEISI